MAIRYIGASAQQEQRLKASQQIINSCIAKNRAKIPPLLLSQLNAMLDPKNSDTVIELEVKDDAQLGFPEPSQRNWAHWGSGGGRYIEVNSRCFDRWTKKGTKEKRPPRLTAVLLHEMVHIAGGNELDAESFENLLLKPEHGAVAPSEKDEEDFKDSKFQGEYVSMDSKTREVSVFMEPGSPKSKGVAWMPKLGILEAEPPTQLPPPEVNKERSMTSENQREQLASMNIATLTKRKKQVGVRVVVEFTGYMDKARLNTFMNGIRTTLEGHVEGNGGNGS